jgi:hypothetical protein
MNMMTGTSELRLAREGGRMVACQQRWLPAAVALRIEQDTIRDARLALGGVAAKLWRARRYSQKTKI